MPSSRSHARLRNHVDERNPVGLRAADAARLQQAHESALVQLAHALVGNAAQLVCLRRACAQPRHHVARDLDRLRSGQAEGRAALCDGGHAYLDAPASVATAGFATSEAG